MLPQRKDFDVKSAFWISLLILVLTSPDLLAISSNSRLPAPEETVEVADIVDGDTIKLKDGRIVRLIGVDCPELYNEEVNAFNAARLDISMAKQDDFAMKAHNYLGGLIGGRSITLAFDPAYRVLEHQDRGGRLYAYIYADGELVNAELIKKGYCTLHHRLTFSKRKEFKEYEESAREARIGIWKASKNIF